MLFGARRAAAGLPASPTDCLAMPAFVGLWCVAGLLGIAAAGLVIGRWPFASGSIYGASLVASVCGLAAALWHLQKDAPKGKVVLALV